MRVEVLSAAEREQVHERTLAVLERVGVRCDTDEGRRILAEAGALVDDQTRIVRFPPELVERRWRPPNGTSRSAAAAPASASASTRASERCSPTVAPRVSSTRPSAGAARRPTTTGWKRRACSTLSTTSACIGVRPSFRPTSRLRLASCATSSRSSPPSPSMCRRRTVTRGSRRGSRRSSTSSSAAVSGCARSLRSRSCSRRPRR